MQARHSPWATLGIFAYLASLVLPAVSFQSGALPGIFCLLFGWFDFLPWSANLALLAAGVLRERGNHRWALACSLLAIALAMTTLREVAHANIDLGVGFFAWIGSMLALAIASSVSIVDREPIARARARERAQRPTVAA
ncbi:MAG TPA: hypothetical protein VGG74_21910 [Kofleriaceae bacterium]|jgi:hypothetical protein